MSLRGLIGLRKLLLKSVRQKLKSFCFTHAFWLSQKWRTWVLRGRSCAGTFWKLTWPTPPAHGAAPKGLGEPPCGEGAREGCRADKTEVILEVDLLEGAWELQVKCQLRS